MSVCFIRSKCGIRACFYLTLEKERSSCCPHLPS